MAKTPTREHREAATTLIRFVASAWVEDPTATYGLAMPELELLRKVSQMLADTDQRSYERGLANRDERCLQSDMQRIREKLAFERGRETERAELEAAERELGKPRDAAKRLVYKTPLHCGLPDTADLSAADLDELHNLLSAAPPDQAPPAKPLTPDDVKAIARAVVAEVAERADELYVPSKTQLQQLAEAAKEGT